MSEPVTIDDADRDTVDELVQSAASTVGFDAEFDANSYIVQVDRLTGGWPASPSTRYVAHRQGLPLLGFDTLTELRQWAGWPNGVLGELE